MRQRTFSMALEVKPDSVATLSALIDDLHQASAANDAQGTSYASFMAEVPSVHFLSMNVFPSADWDPLFVIEANIDGAPSVFWAQLEAMIGDRLRAMIRCCKRPLNQDGPLYDAVTVADSRVMVAPYLEARSIPPSVFHHGNRGLTRERIVAEGELFRATRRVLATDLVPHAATPVAVHRALRERLLADFAWLAAPAPRRIGLGERLADIVRLAAFVVIVVVVLSLPGLIAAPLMPTGRFLILLAAALLLVGVPLYRIREPLPGTATPGAGPLLIVMRTAARNLILIAGLVLAYLAVVLPVWTLGASLATGLPLALAWHAGVRIVLLGLLSAVFSLVGILAWLRWLERRDSSHDAPPIDEAAMRQMAQREDWIPQNHMGSIVIVKPGVLRTIIVRAGHRGLGLALRVKATNGYLGSMRTVHFAHWAFVNNGSRLMFLSNFDQSWESYLDDFIEKAHAGLTLAWGCGAGFPPTRFLIKDGASHGRRFKAWARHSMAISRFWYSAYGDYTVDQIERNNRIANGLRRPNLGARDAALWINDPMSSHGASPSWRLAKPHDTATQGLVVSGFSSLPTGTALFLQLGDDGPRGGAWLAALREVAPITDADGRDPAAAAVAFTAAGLARMGLPPTALQSFSAPFREGMMQEDRLRRLGDRRNGEWLGTVIAGGPVWSANTPRRDPLPGADTAGTALTATGHTEEQVTTATTVHALLLLYDADEATAEARSARVKAILAAHGVTVARELPLELRADAKGIAREHFGFADGVSQPQPYDEEGAVLVGGAVATRDPWNGVPLGEFLFGHLNGHHEKAPGPFTPADDKGVAAGLPPHPLAEGCLDLGLNGAYLVVRELKQDVAAFWQAMERAAARIQGETSSGQAVTAAWLAERVVGRDEDGRLLCPGGYLNAEAQAANAFGFFDRDPHGLGCPTGSHVRRANPRDGLSPDAAHKQDLLDAANNHRMLRRGRKFGPTLIDRTSDDGADRGLLFMAVNTDLVRQFEFVQQTWLLNRNFATLFDETDPLVGPAGPLTVRDHPLRHIVEVETFVRMVGGDYFFLPSLPAITYLASL